MLVSKRQNSVGAAIPHSLSQAFHKFYSNLPLRYGKNVPWFSRQTNRHLLACHKNKGYCLINRYCTRLSRWINYLPACNCRVSNLKSRVIWRLNNSLGILYHLGLFSNTVFILIKDNYDPMPTHQTKARFTRAHFFNRHSIFVLLEAYGRSIKGPHR